MINLESGEIRPRRYNGTDIKRRPVCFLPTVPPEKTRTVKREGLLPFLYTNWNTRMMFFSGPHLRTLRWSVRSEKDSADNSI